MKNTIQSNVLLGIEQALKTHAPDDESDRFQKIIASGLSSKPSSRQGEFVSQFEIFTANISKQDGELILRALEKIDTIHQTTGTTEIFNELTIDWLKLSWKKFIGETKA